MRQRVSMRSFAYFLLALLTAWPAIGAEGPSYAVRAGRIMPATADGPDVIENGVIIVRDGVIVAVGADLAIPSDLRVLSYPDATITPGFVVASTGLAGQHRGDESISGVYRAIDAFNRYGAFVDALAGGVTTVHLNPGVHRLVSGMGGVAKLGGYHDARIVNGASDLAINLVAEALGPPDLEIPLIPPSGDQAIEPSIVQRPTTRMGRMPALRAAIAGDAPDAVSMHVHAFRRAWREEVPIRLTARRVEDLQAAVRFLRSTRRDGYIVGGTEVGQVARMIRDAGVPLVYEVDASLRAARANVGMDPNALVGVLDDLAKLDGVRFALAPDRGASVADFRLIGALALRAGLDESHVLEAMTRVPAEIIGVDEIVGSIEPGKHADFLVMSGSPLETSSHVLRTYVNGNLVYRSDKTTTDAVVVRGGTIWLGPNEWLHNGEVLIEDGMITSVGRSVPHPPGARVIHAGDDAFITPGFIDAHGHLGLMGDRSALEPQLTLARLVGAPGPMETRVASSGVTTVMTAPYSFNRGGSQVSAIRTWGDARDERVVRSTAAVAFDVSGIDPVEVADRIRPRIEAGRKYLEKWQAYYKALEEWKEKKAAGEAVKVDIPKTEESETKTVVEDPITGTWAMRVFGQPLPREFEGQVALRLNGNAIEGRVVEPAAPVEHRIVGTLDGTSIRGSIEVETGGMGTPSWQAELPSEDRMVGTVTVQNFTLNFEGRRVDKGPVEFSVVRTRRRAVGEGGRPLPPKVDESLEPMRAWIEKKIPAVVRVETAQEIDAVLDYVVDDQKLPIVLLGAEHASTLAGRLQASEVGVIVPQAVMRQRENQPYHQADDLSRGGILVAFQSNAEDGARLLPLVGLFAVERGMSAEQALAALTIDAARLYKLDDAIGVIKPGRHGDLVIFNGHPFRTSATIQRVIVNGQEVKP